MEINNDAFGILCSDFDENEVTDLFQQYEILPKNVQKILSKYDDHDETYTNCEKLIKQLNKVGYTCEYYLNAVPYNLKKL